MTAPLPLLDRAHLNAMTGGDTALALEVIDIFREQTGLWTRLMDPKADPRQWADAAHTLKGSSLSLGALELARLCERAGLSDLGVLGAGNGFPAPAPRGDMGQLWAPK